MADHEASPPATAPLAVPEPAGTARSTSTAQATRPTKRATKSEPVYELVVLSDFPTRFDADTVIARLIGEGIPASVVTDDKTGIPRWRRELGPRVLVRPDDYDRAVTITRILDDVDRGRSPLVRPLASSAWSGPIWVKLFGLIALVALLAPAAFAMSRAFAS